MVGRICFSISFLWSELLSYYLHPAITLYVQRWLNLYHSSAIVKTFSLRYLPIQYYDQNGHNDPVKALFGSFVEAFKDIKNKNRLVMRVIFTITVHISPRTNENLIPLFANKTVPGRSSIYHLGNAFLASDFRGFSLCKTG